MLHSFKKLKKKNEIEIQQEYVNEISDAINALLSRQKTSWSHAKTGRLVVDGASWIFLKDKVHLTLKRGDLGVGKFNLWQNFYSRFSCFLKFDFL